jgi:hypothetical protein
MAFLLVDAHQGKTKHRRRTNQHKRPYVTRCLLNHESTKSTEKYHYKGEVMHSLLGLHKKISVNAPMMKSLNLGQSRYFHPQIKASTHHIQKSHDVGMHRHCLIRDLVSPHECTYHHRSRIYHHHFTG